VTTEKMTQAMVTGGQ